MVNHLPMASSIDEGLDRKVLTTLRRRFLQVNAQRLERARGGLGPRSRLLLDLLPLLFHCNHPMLPGYTSRLCPTGVAGYAPDRQDLSRVRKLARSFVYRHRPLPQPALQALFLIGSCGTLGQTESSDLDLWICHAPELTPAERQLLQQKADALSEWSRRELGQDLHCFLMEGGQFHRGSQARITTEDCGSSQHYLLLDEFYRTGLLLAGRIPIWWLVPPAEERNHQHYATTLTRKRYVHPQETLDFGGIERIPAGEFIGAGIWQLYKAIDSPYKSALKLLLTEVYASEYPHIRPLSHLYKEAIHRNRLDIDELDPYVMVYRRLEQYLLARGELDRLELVRRCFYFKVGKALSRRPASPDRSWQRQLLERMVLQWGWTPAQLQQLDNRRHWKADRVMQEQAALVQELTRSYRYLHDFAQRSQAAALISSRDMTLLGRKLYATFERRAGKIEWINPGIAPNLTEDALTLVRSQHSWAVHASTPAELGRTPGHPPLKRDADLLPLVVWSVVNGLADVGTRLQAVGTTSVTEAELRRLLEALQWLAPNPEEQGDPTDRYASANEPERIQLFINIGLNPLGHLHQRGMERLSSQTDSLGYSGLRDNLVRTVDWVQRNRWGDVTTRSFHGPQALLDCLRHYLALFEPGEPRLLPALDIHCFCPSRAEAIAERVRELLQDLTHCFCREGRQPATRYLLEMQHHYCLIQYRNRQPVVRLAEHPEALMRLLEEPLGEPSPLVLDRYCQLPELAAITAAARLGSLTVFYRRRDYHAEVFVVDELGALYRSRMAFHDEHSLLHPLDRFLRAMLFRRAGEQPTTADIPIVYHELISDAQGCRVRPCHPPAYTVGSDFHVQAIAVGQSDGQPLFDIHCGPVSFSSLEWGQELYRAVARHILRQRSGRERYPCYITDLDLAGEPCGEGRIPHHLRHKQWLEARLNRALAEL